MSTVFDLRRATPDESANEVLEGVLAAVRCVAWRVRLADFKTSYVSANAERVLGHAAASWSQYDSWAERVHPADRARVIEESTVALAAGNSFEREYRIVAADGAVVWVHDTIAVVRDATGAPVELHGLTVDVTDRRRREEALRFDRDRLQIAIEAAGVSAWEWHADSNRVVADPLGRPLLRGAPWRDSPASQFLDRVHPDDRDELYARALSSLRSGEPFVASYRVVDHRGEYRRFESHIRPCGSDGRFDTLVGATRDVTEQTVALEEARLRSLLFDALGEGVCVARGNGTIVYANAALERMLGFDVDELVGVDTRELSGRTAGEYAQRDREIRAVLAEQGRWSGEMLNRRKDGTLIHAHGTVTRVVVGGEPLYITVRRDVTERLQLQREVLAAGQREKESLAHALHEGLAQQLSGIALLAGTLRDDGERRGSPVAGSLRRLTGLLQEAVATCRRLAQGVSGFVVRGGGLQIGLRELALAYERRTGAVCDVDVDESASDAMDPERARHLYWIAEDALNACAVPGWATDAVLRLHRVDDRARLRVRIAGPRIGGLDSPESPARKIIGYRAGLLGAGLATMPAQDGGIIIEVLCPLEDGTGVTP
jgi:PAS domain S-box-containing protein